MKREIMKQKLISTKQVVWALVFLLMGMGGAHAMKCVGTVHFQKPDSWATVFMLIDGTFANVTDYCKPTGWCEIPTGSVGATHSESFSLSKGSSYPGTWVSRTQYNFDGQAPTKAQEFTCANFGTGSDLYISANPVSPSLTVFSTEPPNAKYFYVLIPDDEEWMSDVPMISLDGGVTGTPMIASADLCGWYYHVFFDTSPTDNVLVYRQGDVLKEEAIGVNGLWDEDGVADPIPLALYYDLYGSNNLYFVTDDNADGWTDELEAEKGWATIDPGISGVCSYSLAAIIYDTDASLHPAFSCWSQGGEGCQIGAQGIPQAQAVAAVNACIGVTPGIVEPILGPDNKPVLTTGVGTTCFHTPALFNQLFNETPGVNEMSCYNLPFQRSDDGKWEFDSDYYISAGVSVPGGFYPAEIKSEADIFSLAGNPSPAVPAARTKRAAEGAIFVCPPLRAIDPLEGVPAIDVLCNGPGWTGGANCSGLFGDGDDWNTLLTTRFGTDVGWGWSCSDQAPNGWPRYVADSEIPSQKTDGEPRWKGLRNQQFCFESHAKFKHKPGLRFSFRGDDDIWVFIGGKLAVDLGGTHLAAPGYVNLDLITDRNGEPLVVGEEYPIDIFFCDRRTTMSNIRIKTNMYIQQKTGLSYNPSRAGSETDYELCWNETGGGSCEAALGGTGESKTYCGEEIIKRGLPIHYKILRRNGDEVSGGTVADLAEPGVYFGGIDLTTRHTPKINKDRLVGLSPGQYKLVMMVEGKSVEVTFRISGSLDIVSRDAVDPENKSSVWKYVGAAMAGTRIPIYISSIADPGVGDLELDIEGANGQQYSLQVMQIKEGREIPGELNFYETEDSESALPPTAFPRTISEGVDTLWVTVPLSALETTKHVYNIKVSSGTAVASVEFSAPQLIFLEPDDKSRTQITTIKDTIWVGSPYSLKLVAVNPVTGEICTDCNFTVNLGSQTTSRLEIIPSTINIENGEADFAFRSLEEYILTPATLHLLGPSAVIFATLSPLYFEKPPAPFPILAEIFDAKGAVSKNVLHIPPPYFSEAQEYLDGIADSIVIHYDRPFHKDSLPDSIFVRWDLSKSKGDVLDSILIPAEKIRAGVNCVADLCDSVLTIGGIEFSEKLQTTGSSKTDISSWATFKDKFGNATKGAFGTSITDRIPPMILGARVSNKGEGIKEIRLTLSEKVLMNQESPLKELVEASFTYYLRSATEISAEQRYVHLNSSNAGTSLATPKDTLRLLYQHSDASLIFNAGDYVRFRFEEAGIVSDVAGNYPTAYNAKVATPWMNIEGDASSEVVSITMTTTDTEKAKEKMKDSTIVELFPVGLYDSKDSVEAKHPNTLGHIVKTDMGNILSSAEFESVNIKDAVLNIETYYFTNLGSFVAKSKFSIACDDAFFNGDPKDKTTPGNCKENPSYVYAAWNLLSSENRLVGTGAYVAKINTFVSIQKKGKIAEHDQTEMWGVRRGGKTVKSKK